MIVKCTLEHADQECDVNVEADDTDVLVLLMYHTGSRVQQKYISCQK